MSRNDEYIQKLVKELEVQGVSNGIDSSEHVENINDYDLRVIADIEAATGTSFSDEQRDILLHKGSACILATAGSGKTTTSVNLIAKRIITGEVNIDKMVYATYSKSGATEMKERLESVLKKLGISRNVQVRTLHSFFLQLLRTFGVVADIVKESDRTKFVREACKEAGFVPKEDDLMIVDNLLSFQVNNLLSDKKTVGSYVNTVDNLNLETYSKIRIGYANKKMAAGLIDYDDMQSYLYLWLVKFAKSTDEKEVSTAVGVRNYCKAMYDHFFIDEAQDVSKIQFAILRALITDPDDNKKLDKELVFIGDDDQAIYQWRGSDPSIILSVGPTFNIKTFVLSTNYRCGSNIVEYASKGIKCNSSRYEKSMQAYNPGGKVSITIVNDEELCGISKVAFEHIKHLIENGESAENIAVLARNNFHLAILSNMLFKAGIYCHYTEDMKLTKSYMFKEIDKIIKLSEECWTSEITASMLWKLCRYMSTGTAKIIADFQDNSNLSFRQTLGYILKSVLNYNIDFSDKVHTNIQAFEKLEYATKGFGQETIEDMTNVYNIVCLSDKVEALKMLMSIYVINTTVFLYKSVDKQRSLRGICRYIYDLARESGMDKLKELLRVTKQYESGNVGIIGKRVTLTTMHSAKGREWKHVIMFASDNISQPSLYGIKALLNDEIPMEDIKENIEEERRLFYVGNTRAKSNLLVITNKVPGIFVMESLGLISGNYNDIIINAAMDPEGEEFVLSDYISQARKIILDVNGPYYYDKDKYTI